MKAFRDPCDTGKLMQRLLDGMLLSLAHNIYCDWSSAEMARLLNFKALRNENLSERELGEDRTITRHSLDYMTKLVAEIVDTHHLFDVPP
eukprot:4611188-Amphidinium_carterae.1